MAQKIVYNYTEMQNAVAKITEISEQYKKLGGSFNSKFKEAIREWEGESKDKMVKLIDGDVNQLLTTDIPKYLEGLASLLSQNIEQMQKADSQIAESIPDQLA